MGHDVFCLTDRKEIEGEKCVVDVCVVLRGRDVCTHHIHAVWRRSVIGQLSHNVFMAHKSGHMNGRKSRLPEKQEITTSFQNNTPKQMDLPGFLHE